MASVADPGSQASTPKPAAVATSAMFGIVKAFGGVSAIGTVFMWLIGHTYSTDILNQYGISSELIDRPWTSEALLGLQVLPQWVADMVKGNEVLVVLLPTAIVLLAALTLAKGSALVGGIATVIFGVLAFAAAPVVGHGEAVHYLAELQAIIANCQRSAASCTSYVKVDGQVVKGVLITADPTKMFVASRNSVTQIRVADLASANPPVTPSPVDPVAQTPVAATSTEPAAIPTPDATATVTATPVAVMPTQPMPEDAVIAHAMPNLPLAHLVKPQLMHAPVPAFLPNGPIVIQPHKSAHEIPNHQ